MNELDETEKNKKQKPHAIPMLVAAIISSLYFAALVFLLTSIQHCPPVYNVTDFEVTLAFDWFYQKLHCRSFNELGDFLAGAFAPVAFLWLVAAVFIQSRELAAQRQELELTRDEAKLMRDEVTASVMQMTEQTKVMQHEREDRERKQNEEYCEANFQRILEMANSATWEFIGSFVQTNNSILTVGDPTKIKEFPKAANINELTNGFEQTLNMLVEEKSAWDANSQKLHDTVFPNWQLKMTSALLAELHKQVSESSNILLVTKYPPKFLQRSVRAIFEIECLQKEFLNENQ